MSFAAPLRLRLDSEALIANWRAMASLSGNAQTGAAVKADAYGLGAREVVPRLWKAGCRDFFVAHWGEAEALADLIPTSSIAVLNGIAEQDVEAAIALGAAPVLNTPHQISLWKNANGRRCHVMLDSGINRLGIGPEQFSPKLFDRLDIDILLTHLASADEDVPQNAQQLTTFIAMSEGISAKRRSMANSAGIALGSDYHFDLTRPGLALYGGAAHLHLRTSIRQVVLPQARILQVRDVAAGSTVGYNATYTTQKRTTVATLAIGYADGYFRGFSNSGSICVNGTECLVLGRVSMDLITVDVSAAPEVAEGDWCDVNFDLRLASEWSGMSQYELLTALSDRADRRWI
ncbi:alanine racemase [Sphingorhabdus pulchriflava]|uniref:Alanine racemase n=1 Tax=Sphingorhabdus pulchriflava TaxID=2292257 RepID=A0A371BH01_9SPHN|nr:alanine racemase [Sphingorhabdus pulchriflava]RDV06866.1 alanine racemase [Sphingorhabdus pulchriflava]